MLAPFDPDGNLMHYPQRTYASGSDYVAGASAYIEPEWHEVVEWHGELHLEEMQRGRSAAYFIWKDAFGRSYPMFMTDMLDVAQKSAIEYGTCKATWKYVKRGQNYGIALASG